MGPGGFRARAGTLTLLYIASSTERHVLLEILADAVYGGEMAEEDDSRPDVEIGPDDIEDSEIDLGPDDAELPGFALDSDVVVGPETPLKITPMGRELVFVCFGLERWLRNSPKGPLQLGTEEAGTALSALVCGWTATVIHALAREPLTLPELNRAIAILGYGTLEEHLDAMEHTDLVEARPGGDGETHYAATDWLREGIAPLAAASRLECHYPADDTAPLAPLDVEAAFLLTLPLLELPGRLSGSCRLGVELGDGEGSQLLAGATAQVEDGRVVSCAVPLEDFEASAWAIASAGDWLDTVIEPDANRIRTGGDRRLARALLDGLHETLFGIPVR